MNGSYRRYSDDIAVVVSHEIGARAVIEAVEEELLKIGLWLSDKKTEVSEFSISSGTLKADKPFQYLGFTFDGQHTRIRQSSLNRYYTKMHTGIRSKVRAAKHNEVEKTQSFFVSFISDILTLEKHVISQDTRIEQQKSSMLPKLKVKLDAICPYSKKR